MSMLTLDEVHSAQTAWGNGIVAIASAHSSGGDFVSIARNHVDTLYARIWNFEIDIVLFKPTEFLLFKPASCSGTV